MRQPYNREAFELEDGAALMDGRRIVAGLQTSRNVVALVAISAAWGCAHGNTERTEPPPVTPGDVPAGPEVTEDSGVRADAGSPPGNCTASHSEVGQGTVEDLFGWPRVPRIDLFLPEEQWQQLQIHARDEEYVEAQACFEGGSLGTVGLRFKGSYGTLYTCFDERGENTCRKLSMKLKFDKYDPEQRFYGLKRLNLQGNRYDDSYMKERLGYDIYRAMGIEAPHAAWAEVRVNGEPQGLFGMVEQVDGRFTKHRWPDDGDGNLYKEIWPDTTDPGAVASGLKTNEEEADTDVFVAFAEAMSNADDDELRATLARFMNLEQLARYMAVDDAILNVDGVTAFYTDDQGWVSNHNFFLYESADGKFTLIPWDLDSTFDTISYFGSVPSWTETPTDCVQSYGVWGGESRVIAAGCDVVFRALATDLTSYRAAAEELLEGPLAQSALLSAIDRHADFIREAAGSDPNGPGVARWEAAVDALRERVPVLRHRFERLLSGEAWQPQVLDTTQTTDFEAQDELGLLAGVRAHANPNSTISVHLESQQPLAGAQSARFDFEYRNEESPWEQWSLLEIPLASGQGDLLALEGIRLHVRADQSRSLRLSLSSPRSSAFDAGILFGWDLAVGEETKTVEVLFADVAMPQWAIDSGAAPDDDPMDILQAVTALRFFPEPVGRDLAGQLPDGTSDAGFLLIDEIEFF